MNNLGSIPLQPGENVPEEDYERPLSAPPPPGFGGGAEERNRLADELLWGTSYTAGDGAGRDDYFQRNVNSTHSGGVSGIHSSTLDARTSSFTNLAAVLGTGLAESMEDATQDRNNSSSNCQGKDDLLSYNRMKRHAASRIMRQPSSPPKQNDPMFSQYNNGAESRSVAPFSLYPQQHAEQRNRTGIAYSSAPGDARNASALQNNQHISQEYPWSLSTPQRGRSDAMQAEKEQVVRRSTTPVQMFPGHQSTGQRRALPVTKDIGMNVMEPEGESQFSGAFNGVISQRIDPQPQLPSDPTIGSDSNRSMKELERGMQNLWSPEAREFKPASAGPSSQNSSISDPGTEISPRQAEMDLQPFLWNVNSNKASRTLAILHVSWVRVPDVRSSCETFGALESFRADFSSRGIFFVSYYDIRSAQYAALELQAILQRLSVMQGSNEEVVVRYCLSLSSSSQFDESQILISNLPVDVNDYSLKTMLSSYGALRSVAYQDDGSYLIEFHNLQDTKQALLELDSSQPWGPHVIVEGNVRTGTERKRCRELLSMISRWRNGVSRSSNQQAANHGIEIHSFQQASLVGQSQDPWRREAVPSHHMQELPQTQYILGSDGRYTQVILQNTAGYPQYGAASIDMRRQQVIQGANGQIYIAAGMNQQHNAQTFVPQHGSHHSATLVAGAPYGDRRQHSNTPYYAHVVTSDATSLSGRSHRSMQSHGTEDKDNRHLMLDLDAVEVGQDTRTSLMVRNIPNKYTQQMLLSEFEGNGHGPGVIDFFYLPIDFKNRCNRGYAFINFVDHKDILAFHRRYYGKHWRTFNSDKICDITYARIQGKDAMLKRFENSALMEKDDEYKPLVFASAGSAKGTRLPFPDPSQHNNHGRAEV
jgi:RNA recognition motif 2